MFYHIIILLLVVVKQHPINNVDDTLTLFLLRLVRVNFGRVRSLPRTVLKSNMYLEPGDLYM